MASIARVSHQHQDRDHTENDLQIVLRSESGILEVLSHVDEEDLHLLGFPTPDVGKNAQGDPFQTVEELVVVESSYFFLQADGQSDLSMIYGTVLVLTSFLSLGHTPTGMGSTWWWTFMKPASLTHPSSLGPGSGSIPRVLRPSMTSIVHRSNGQPGLNSPPLAV